MPKFTRNEVDDVHQIFEAPKAPGPAESNVNQTVDHLQQAVRHPTALQDRLYPSRCFFTVLPNST